MGLTTDPHDPDLGQDRGDGQNKKYLVLSEEERAKGFVRPVRTKYIHLGRKMEGTLIRYEKPKVENGKTYIGYFKLKGLSGGPLVTEEEYQEIKKGKRVRGCGSVTVMGQALAETYARDPKFYGSTFCCGCGTHKPVSEFVWDGTDEEVGS